MTPGGLLGRLDPRPKLLALIAFLVAVSLVPAAPAHGLGSLACILALALLSARLPWSGRFWLRLLPLMILALGMALLVAFSSAGEPIFDLGASLTVTHKGLVAAAVLLARTALAGSALVALSLTTPGPDLVAALRWFRVPETFVAVLGAVARTLGLVTAEASRMNRARELRTVRPRLGLALRAVGGILGSLLSRSLARAERVHRAMLARGYTGTLPQRRPPAPVPAAHLLVSGLFASAALAAALAPWGWISSWLSH